MISRSGTDRDWGTVLLGAAAIVVVAVCLGLVANQRSSHRLPLLASEESLRPPAPATVGYLSLDEARRQLDDPEALFLDARVPEAFAAGHIRGALSLPVGDFDELHPGLEERLQAASALIVYCDNIVCDDAARLSEALVSAGYPRISLMFEGWEGWRDADYPSSPGAKGEE
jgi:rhodanese-related sulfurtransferase